MYYVGSENFEELDIGHELICSEVSPESDGHLTVGRKYVIYGFEGDNIAFVDNNGRRWFMNIGDVFKKVNDFKVKKQPYRIGDTIRCIDAFGTSLTLNEEYVANWVSTKSVKIMGNETAWKLSRFEKVELKVGQRVKVLKNSFANEKWHPQAGEEYVIKTIKGDKIGVEFPKEKKAPEQYADGVKAVWPKGMFKAIPTAVKEEVKVKKVPKIKLDAKKLHVHNCIRCERQIFPKTMCKCNVTIDIPM